MFGVHEARQPEDADETREEETSDEEHEVQHSACSLRGRGDGRLKNSVNLKIQYSRLLANALY